MRWTVALLATSGCTLAPVDGILTPTRREGSGMLVQRGVGVEMIAYDLGVRGPPALLDPRAELFFAEWDESLAELGLEPGPVSAGDRPAPVPRLVQHWDADEERWKVHADAPPLDLPRCPPGQNGEAGRCLVAACEVGWTRLEGGCATSFIGAPVHLELVDRCRPEAIALDGAGGRHVALTCPGLVRSDIDVSLVEVSATSALRVELSVSTPGNDRIRAMARNASGVIMAVGYTYGVPSDESQPARTRGDALIVRILVGGAINTTTLDIGGDEWFDAVAHSPAGRTYVSGRTTGSVDSSAPGVEDVAFVAELVSTGTQIRWGAQLPRSTRASYGLSVANTTGGDVLLFGHRDGEAALAKRAAFLRRFNAEGAERPGGERDFDDPGYEQDGVGVVAIGEDWVAAANVVATTRMTHAILYGPRGGTLDLPPGSALESLVADGDRIWAIGTDALDPVVYVVDAKSLTLVDTRKLGTNGRAYDGAIGEGGSLHVVWESSGAVWVGELRR